MPLYDYGCKVCGAEFEAYRKIANRYKVECLICQGEIEILMTCGKRHFFPEGFWDDLAFDPIYISSRAQLRRECEERGKYAKYLDGFAGY